MTDAKVIKVRPSALDYSVLLLDAKGDVFGSVAVKLANSHETALFFAKIELNKFYPNESQISERLASWKVIHALSKEEKTFSAEQN